MNSFLEEQEIPPDYLACAFSNGALDATLALSIFNKIFSSNNYALACLMVEMNRKTGFSAPANIGWGLFQGVLRWFNRAWVCKRDNRGIITVRERHRAQTISCGEDLIYGHDIFEKVFREL